MEPEPTEATLAELERKLEREDELYGELLATLDRLSENPPLYERDPEIPEILGELNRSAALAPSPEEPTAPPSGLKGLVRRLARKLVEPELDALSRALARQRQFDSLVVQSLNRLAESENARGARAAELASALVRFAQRIDRLADAKDRLYASLGNRRADLLLEAMDKRLESVRLGIARAQERVEGLATGVALARAELSALSAPASPGSFTTEERRENLNEAHYLAFEERFRGSEEEIRRRLADYVAEFRGKAPVVDLGCGRGEFLDLLRADGIEGRGVDGNRDMVRVCKERGLACEHGDVLSYLAGREPGSVGGIFAAQLVEHLPPRELGRFLESCHRALRAQGRLVLETVNPRSVVALVESFFRDLTHEKPLHPETLDFAVRAAGFCDVSIRYKSPVSERAKLLPVVGASEENRTLNHNFDKLNAFLYGDQDYAIVATR